MSYFWKSRYLFVNYMTNSNLNVKTQISILTVHTNSRIINEQNKFCSYSVTVRQSAAQASRPTKTYTGNT